MFTQGGTIVMDLLVERTRIILEQIGKVIDENQRFRLLFKYVRMFCRDFLLAWLARGGVGVLPHLIRAFRMKK